MQVTLNPQIQQWVEKLVNRGSFESPEAVIEAAVGRMVLDHESPPLDEPTIAKLARALEQCKQGQVRKFADVAREFRDRAAQIAK